MEVLKSWIEELLSKNRDLEEENNSLKEANSTLEEETNSLKGQLDEHKRAFKQLTKDAKLILSSSRSRRTRRARSGSRSRSVQSVVSASAVSAAASGDDDHNVATDEEDDTHTLVPSPSPRDCQHGHSCRKRRKVQSSDSESHEDSDAGNMSSDFLDSSDEEERRRIKTFPSKNPFNIEEIVRVLMDYVDPDDLTACRRVNKMWKHEATRQMQEKLTFHVDFYRKKKVKEFLDDVSTSFPNFRNLKVDVKGSDWPQYTFNTLLMRHGKALHNLVVRFGYSQNWGMDDFRDLFLASLGEIRSLRLKGLRCLLIHEPRIFNANHAQVILPHLTCLSIGLTPCSDNHRNETQVFCDLLRLAPNLTTLHWSTKKQDDIEKDGSRIMIDSLLQVNPPKFEQLFIHSPISNTLVTRLSNSTLKLKQLYFTELQSFEVHLAIPTSGSKTNLIPKRVCYSKITGKELKQHLEDKLAEVEEDLFCPGLLKTFTTCLAAKLIEG